MSFRDLKVPYMLIGALALPVWGRPRATLDIDFMILAEKIPEARLAMIKDTGHFPHMEKPELVNEAIWSWLDEKRVSGKNAG